MSCLGKIKTRPKRSAVEKGFRKIIKGSKGYLRCGQPRKPGEKSCQGLGNPVLFDITGRPITVRKGVGEQLLEN